MLYEEIKVGDTASFEKTISKEDVFAFAGVTGDFNPLHIDETHAENTRFGKRIAHGMLTGSLFSTVFGMKLPGEGAIYLSQTLSFLAPVFFGDTIKATAVVKEKLGKGRVKFDCVATNQDGEVVVRGEAVLLAAKERPNG